MTTIDHNIEKLSERMKSIEDKIDMIMRHLKIALPEDITADAHLRPVDIKLREE